MNGLSKRLVSLTMATAMVFSLTAVPATEAKAATASITSKTTSVQVGKAYTYKIKASKAKKVKVSVSGTAAKAVRVNGKKATSGSNTITLKGGKTLTVEVKVNPSKTVAGKKFTINYKLDKKKAVKTKSIKVNYPTKGVTLDQTALTMKAGETATLKATMTTVGTNSKIKSWVSSDEKVATVNNGVVTAVGGGEATITVTTSNGKTATAKVTVEGEKKAEQITMTSLTATAADTFKATFAASVPADATISVSRTKSTTGYVGVATWNADRTELTYKLDSDFVADTYTLTVAAGDDNKSSLTYEATARKATSIVFTNKDDIALSGKGTGDNADKLMYAYVYYDILDQYGDSVRATTSVQLSGSTSTVSADRSTGKITITAGANTPFRYGDPVSVTVVDPKNGLAQTATLKVGLEQQVDSVKIAGFVSTDSSATMLTKLPKNFDVNKYLVLYQALDQQGNVMDDADPNANGIVGDEITITTDAPLLVKTEFKDGGVDYGAKNYTIGGVSYYAFTIAPGQYADKGGSANITVISNKTGTKTPCVIDIDAAGVLQSLVLNTPANTVADGEWTGLTYTATTTTGETTTDYETIVRSTNELKLSVSVGTLTVSEGNNGEACFGWMDSEAQVSSYDDGVDRPVIITSIVIGGQTDAMQFSVADKAYPVSIPTIKTTSGTNTFTYGGSLEVDFTKWDLNTIKFKDQYGREMRGEDAVARINFLNANSKFRSALAIVADIVEKPFGQTGKFNKADGTVADKITFSCVSGNATELTESVKFFVGITDNNKKATYLANPTTKESYELLNAAGAANTVTYTCVAYDKIKNIKINQYDKLPLIGTFSSYTNILEYNKKNPDEVKAGDEAGITSASGKKWMTVEGVANGEAVYIPSSMVTVSGNGAFGLDSTWGHGYGLYATSAFTSTLKVQDLYNTSTTTMDRKDLTKTLTIIVNGKDVVEKDITMSDAAPYVASIKFYDRDANEIKDATVIDPDSMNVATTIKNTLKADNKHYNAAGINEGIVVGKWLSGDYMVIVFRNQYGEIMDPSTILDGDGASRVKLEYADLTENKADLAHKADSLAVADNNSIKANLTGAEIKDVVTLNVKADNTKSTMKITVGGDLAAYITDTSDVSDKTFRKTTLGYTDR